REAASTGPVSTPPEPGFPFRADAISPTQNFAKRDPAVGKKLRHDNGYNRGAKPVSNGLRPSYVIRPDEQNTYAGHHCASFYQSADCDHPVHDSRRRRKFLGPGVEEKREPGAKILPHRRGGNPGVNNSHDGYLPSLRHNTNPEGQHSQ